MVARAPGDAAACDCGTFNTFPATWPFTPSNLGQRGTVPCYAGSERAAPVSPGLHRAGRRPLTAATRHDACPSAHRQRTAARWLRSAPGFTALAAAVRLPDGGPTAGRGRAAPVSPRAYSARRRPLAAVPRQSAWPAPGRGRTRCPRLQRPAGCAVAPTGERNDCPVVTEAARPPGREAMKAADLTGGAWRTAWLAARGITAG